MNNQTCITTKKHKNINMVSSTPTPTPTSSQSVHDMNIDACDYNKMLFLKEFNEDELRNIAEHVSMKRILITQKNLSGKFVEDYILNDEYHVDDSDESLTIEDVLHYQSHLESYFNSHK